MAYTSGGLIQALDYNLFTWGGNTTGTYANVAGQPNLAWVYGTGKGYAGYGQPISALTTVTGGAGGSTVSALQWSTFIYMLNLVLGHQGGATNRLASGSNIGIVTGATITQFANVQAQVANVVSNCNLAASQGATITGSNFTYNFIAGNVGAVNVPAKQTEYLGSVSRTVTFASGDAARYFFNAGGQLNFVIASVTNSTGKTKGTDWITVLQTYINTVTYKANTAVRTGTGGGNLKVVANAAGYWGSNTTSQIICNVSSTATSTGNWYDNDWAAVLANVNSPSGANLDNGNNVTFTLALKQAPMTGNFWDQNVSLTITHRVDIIPPETTYFANVWGVIGVT
jgi:hypothetical protein